MIKECKTHGLTEFKRHSNGSGRPDTYRCRLCWRETRNKKRNDRKSQIIEEMGGKCVICGYNKNIAAIDFHHIDPTTKVCEVSNLMLGSIAKTRKEIEKCVLVCKNCHAEIENTDPTALNLLQEYIKGSTPRTGQLLPQ